MYRKDVMPCPNIIFSMAGDMGCSNVGCCDPRSGIPAPTCTPTRYGTPF